MLNTRVAKRYAKGLWDFAVEQNIQEVVISEITNLVQVIKESKPLRLFLKSPILDYKKKISISKELFKNYSETTQNFIKLVINHRRESDLLLIGEQFVNLANEEKGIQNLRITSAVKLDEASINTIVSKLNLGDPSKVIIENKIEPSIIGGYILRIGDKQLDASIKSKLLKLKNDFDDNQYISTFFER